MKQFILRVYFDLQPGRNTGVQKVVKYIGCICSTGCHVANAVTNPIGNCNKALNISGYMLQVTCCWNSNIACEQTLKEFFPSHPSQVDLQINVCDWWDEITPRLHGGTAVNLIHRMLREHHARTHSFHKCIFWTVLSTISITSMPCRITFVSLKSLCELRSVFWSSIAPQMDDIITQWSPQTLSLETEQEPSVTLWKGTDRSYTRVIS